MSYFTPNDFSFGIVTIDVAVVDQHDLVRAFGGTSVAGDKVEPSASIDVKSRTTF